MHINQIIGLQSIIPQCPASSKKSALQAICQQFTRLNADLDARQLLGEFMTRERLGSTAVGHGVAIPHVRSPNIQAPLACFCQLVHPVDYDAPDNTPVDLIFALLVPNDAPDTHLQLLSELAQKMHQDSQRKALRAAKTAPKLLGAFNEQ